VRQLCTCVNNMWRAFPTHSGESHDWGSPNSGRCCEQGMQRQRVLVRSSSVVLRVLLTGKQCFCSAATRAMKRRGVGNYHIEPVPEDPLFFPRRSSCRTITPFLERLCRRLPFSREAEKKGAKTTKKELVGNTALYKVAVVATGSHWSSPEATVYMKA
jgi:hypothetical protein